MIQLTFEGHIPSKKNSKRVVKRGKKTIVLPSKAYEEWNKEELKTLKGQSKIDSPVTIDYQFWIGGVTSPSDFDLSNAIESVNDTLVDAEILDSDSWQFIVQSSYGVAGFIRGDSKTIVTITPVEVPWFEPVSILKSKEEIKRLSILRGVTQKAIVDECWGLITNL